EGKEGSLQPRLLAPTITPLVRRAGDAEAGQAESRIAGEDFSPSSDFESRLETARGGGAPLPASTRGRMEQQMGADFSGVKVHTDAQSDEMNRAIQAKAFTTGQDVFFRQGAYDPGSRGGQELIAHELTHVVQQNGGAVQRSTHLIQRDTTQNVNDQDIMYDKIQESAINQHVILEKQKTLYQDKGANPHKNEDGGNVVIPKGSLVKLLERPSAEGKWSRSYAKIQFKGFQGWINTKTALKEGQITGHEPAGVVMPNGVPTVGDVKQGMMGDCFLLAALMSLVQTRPGYIKNNLFQTDPTQPVANHTVRFHKVTNYKAGLAPERLRFSPEDVTVKNTILKTRKTIKKPSETIEANRPVGSHGNQLWPAIVEKAFAIGGRKLAYHGSSDLSGGHGFQASMILTGEGYQSMGMSGGVRGDWREMVENKQAKDEEEAEQIILNRNQAAAKAAVIDAFVTKSPRLKTAGTKQSPPDDWKRRNRSAGVGASGEMKVGGITFKHEYSIVHADVNKIHLRNPWGSFARVNGVVRPHEAVSILTWDEFFQVFDEVGL
ncbi:MAG: hypothetical protein RLZZ165_1713, partial [Bacteroidota bacterium]